MAASPTPSPADFPVVAVAVSGGRDSMALLHATLRAAQPLNLRVCALHVHHGLNPNADTWLAHVRTTCQRWARRGHNLGFRAARIASRPTAGQSVEAWAREVRYAALQEMAWQERATLLLLAHHQRDQAETWLLQALRGAGATGLSAMPSTRTHMNLQLARPWLAQPAPAIAAYAHRHRIAFVHDDSNDDERYARNRLRLRVMPALRDAFDGADAALAASAAQAQDAQACLQALATLDLSPCSEGEILQTAAWQQLAPARARNALRHWLAGVLGRGAPESLIARLMQEIPGTRTARWPAPGGELRLYRGALGYEPAPSRTQLPGGRQSLSITAPGSFHFPAWAGTLRVSTCTREGISAAQLHRCELRPRQAGDRFQAQPGSTARSLKLQFQSARVPMWQRQGPVLSCADSLVFVPGLGIDARFMAPPATAQLTMEWIADAPAAPAPRAAG